MYIRKISVIRYYIHVVKDGRIQWQSININLLTSPQEFILCKSHFSKIFFIKVVQFNTEESQSTKRGIYFYYEVLNK